MSKLKTLPNDGDVMKFINSVEDEKKRNDSLKLLELFRDATGLEPKMWGGSIIGFGMYHYKSERSSQEGDWPLTGFSPRKQNLTIYIMPGFDEYKDLLEKIGKSKTSVSCLYLKNLDNVDINALKEIIVKSVERMKKIHNVE